MDELDPQVIAAIERAAREASDPNQRDRLSAAAAIFAALTRADSRQRHAWLIVQAVATSTIEHLFDVSSAPERILLSHPEYDLARVRETARALLGGEK